MKYRIVDHTDDINECNTIQIQKQSLLDKIFFSGWWTEKVFIYKHANCAYPKTTREEAIADAEKWIEDLKSNSKKVKTTVLKEFK